MNLLDSKRPNTLAALGAALLVCLSASAGAQAQTVYRIVGSDGRVTFTDKPPVDSDQGKVASTGVGSAAAASASALPFELRQVAARYPVTLYSGPDCGPCAAGRSMLNSRGVPFSERSVTTAEDVAALKRLTGDASLPFLNIGAQRIKGYSDVEWTQYLDAAGYPKMSVLPPTYRQAAATPLVALDKPAVARAEEKPETKPETTNSAAPAPAAVNPAGIQF
jgi:glutaredoxin